MKDKKSKNSKRVSIGGEEAQQPPGGTGQQPEKSTTDDGDMEIDSPPRNKRDAVGSLTITPDGKAKRSTKMSKGAKVNTTFPVPLKDAKTSGGMTVNYE